LNESTYFFSLVFICLFLLISNVSGQNGESDYEKTIEAYDRALQINPDNADVWFNKGMTLKKMGKSSEGERCIEKAIILYICR
jgi:tetratricopeptide (TPR) repeat protein